MSAIDTIGQIAKAEARADFDIGAAAAASAGKTPVDIVSVDVVDQRRGFLATSLADGGEANQALERILLGNELQPVSYFERGAIAARAVARIAIRSSMGSGWGTGFMISPGVLLTNNHVLPNAATARGSLAQFEFELDADDQPTGPVSFELDPGALFHTSIELDFTVVAVTPKSSSGHGDLAAYGCLPLLQDEGKAFEGEWLTIVQHPAGERKQVCVRENKLIKRAETVLWYATDTMSGSSGSPVFNNDWYIVALHHMGVPERRAGVIQTLDGRDYDDRTMDETQIKWVANEGIRASRIAKALQAALPDHPLLLPLYAATPQSARVGGKARPAAPSPSPVAAPHRPDFIPPRASQKGPPAMADTGTFPLELRLRIGADGSASIVGGSAAETDFTAEDAKPKKKREPAYDAPFDFDYKNRNGFNPAFLDDSDKRLAVRLPDLDANLLEDVAPLVEPKDGHVLKYRNYSLVMHAKRRLAIYSAANIDFANRFDISRPPDVWRRDPRILAKYQIENWYYQSNQFDRGHLTRNEDMEYGASAVAALQAAADTCHWTNCTPQHSKFNQNKEIWQGIERYILEDSIFDTERKLRAQVITGPVFDPADPVYKQVQYPVQYWKVVVALDGARRLSATAYIASQAEVIAKFGIEAAAPFGAYQNFQTTVEEIERLTGLTFRCGDKADPGFLRDFDPLKKKPVRGRRAGMTLAESYAASVGSASAYIPLGELEDIEL